MPATPLKMLVASGAVLAHRSPRGRERCTASELGTSCASLHEPLDCISSRRLWGGSPARPRTSGQRRGSLRSWSGRIVREVLTGRERTKLDPSNDFAFYDMPRICFHVDDNFLQQVTRLYRQRIPEGGVVLDLMSSWVSHLPEDVEYKKVIGHGMNEAELARNKRLSTWFLRNLNAEPDGWDIDDASVDAVVCCVSVQYLQGPERVFAEIFRVLKPGGVCIMTFSNRMFYTKATAAWRNGSDYSHCQLVSQYFLAVDGFTMPEVLTEVPETEIDRKAQAGIVSQLRRLYSSALSRLKGNDPFYAVVSYRDFKITSQ